MNRDDVIQVFALGSQWETADPFLFCVHHDDAYPAGNADMGPAAALDGRDIGQDFSRKDGWSMYHGDVVPGFPQHPHRGFETVTLARRGFIDHSDSLGATARFGVGDAQWMTAGRGIVHSEMFPLRNEDRDNPVELFQIWLNLPASDKLVEPYFSMFWSEMIARHEARDDSNQITEIALIAGSLGDMQASPPPPNSWAARPHAEVAIWTIWMSAGARWRLPPASTGVNRRLYFFRGTALRAGQHDIPPYSGVALRAEAAPWLHNRGNDEVELLLLQGRPIGEPVAHYGPFVMNSRAEIQQAIVDYQRTQFGGWPWPHPGPVHARDQGRFAIHADGRTEGPKCT